MVDHDQKGVKTIRKGQVSDQITRDLLEGAGARGWNGKEQGTRQVCIDFILLTRGTPTDILTDKGCKAQPPEFQGNKLASFENTRMTSRRVVMVAGNDRVAEIGISRNIDTVLKSQDTGIVMPVGEARAKFRRGFTGESMEGIKDKWI